MSGVRTIIVTALLMAVLALGSVCLAGSPLGDLPAFIPPVLATSCGQGPGIARVWESCDRLGIVCWVEPQLRMGDLGTACCPESGCPFGGVLFVAIGIDDAALRALEIDIAYEVARCRALLERARELGMAIVVALIDEPTRDASEAETELLVSFAPTADLVITSGVTVGRTTLDPLSSRLQIPCVELNGPQDLDALLTQLFSPEM